ncbi:hypothetical protein [Actinomadura harenae]|nr:hypothetical protein [Actinomadura harenae]
MSNLPPEMLYRMSPRGRRRSRGGTVLGVVVLLGIGGFITWPHVSGWFRNDPVVAQIIHCQVEGSPTEPPPLENFDVTAVFRNRTGRALTFLVKDRSGHVLTNVDFRAGDPETETIDPHGTVTEGYEILGSFNNTCGDMAVRPKVLKGN